MFRPKITCSISALAIAGAISVYWILFIGTATTGAVRPSVDGRELRSGDLIFRRGPSLESQMVMTMDGNTSFSHVGIVRKEKDSTFVIHVSPGESGDIPDATKIEPIEDFLRSDRAVSARAYRVISNEPSQIDTAVRVGQSYADRHVPFDNKFDLSSDDAIYCTELVWKAYGRAGIDLVDGRLDVSTLPFIHGPILWPSSLMRSSHISLVWGWDARKEN